MRPSKLLIDEHPLQVLPSLVVAVGLNRAIFLQQLHYWLRKPGAHERTGADGVTRRWVHNTYEEWHDQFPFWEPESIRKLVSGFKRTDVLLATGEFNADPRDRTLWYSIDYAALDALMGVEVAREEEREEEGVGADGEPPEGLVEAGPEDVPGGAEDVPHGPEESTGPPGRKYRLQPEESTGSIYTETSSRDSALQAGRPPENAQDPSPGGGADSAAERPMSPASYCVKALVEKIGAARATGTRVEPLPGSKRGEYGNFYDAYLKDGWEVEDLGRVLDRLVERASGKNGEWIKFGWAASDVEAGYSGDGPPGTAVHPQGEEAEKAKEKPRRPEWYSAFYGGAPENYERMILEGLGHSQIEERASRA